MKTDFYKTAFIILICSMGWMSCSKNEFPVAGEDALSSQSFSTFSPENVTMTTASIKGVVKNIPAGNIIESGVLLTDLNADLIKDPSLISGLAGKKYSATIEGNGNFYAALTNLKADTRYGYIGFVTTLKGTTYGKMNILVTSYGTIDDVDGNVHQTVRIGSQIWMRENLKTAHYSDQTPISGSYDLLTDELYGKHYSWDGANAINSQVKLLGSQGACPTGWHVPGDGEWQELLTYLGVPSNKLNTLNLIGDNQAELLKNANTEYWNNESIKNSTGFSALPAGIVKECQEQWSVQSAYWTSTPGIYYGFQKESEKIYRGNHPNCTCGLSVRCIKD